jgi:hypothetical protein
MVERMTGKKKSPGTLAKFTAHQFKKGNNKNPPGIVIYI